MLPIPQTPVSDLPTADRWLCKPKSHSYRCFALRDGKTVDIRSKRGTLLNRHFPYVVAALAKVNAQTFVLDGELLVISDGRRDFDSEQLRMHPGESRAKKLSAEAPALFMAFDLVVAAKGKDVSREPFEVRREVLEVRGAGKSPMIPAVRDRTVDRHGARLVEAGRSGIDGIVAKRGAERDPAGKRMMQKFNRWNPIDAVVGGIYEDDRGHVERSKTRKRRNMPKTILVTSGDGDFGFPTALALGKAGHTVYARLHRLTGDPADKMLEAAIEEDVEIRLVELDVLSQTSVDSAVASSTLRPPPGYGDRLAGSQ